MPYRETSGADPDRFTLVHVNRTGSQIVFKVLWCFHIRARQRQDNDKTNVEPMHSSDAFHTRSDKPGVKCIIGMHRFDICLAVVLSVSWSGVKTTSVLHAKLRG